MSTTEKDFQTEANEAGERFAEHAKELLDTLHAAQESEDDDAAEDAENQIHEYPLSVLTRSGWHTPGSGPEADAEYEILLGTGGPASRIVGELSEYGEPDSAVFEYQDWFKPWTAARLDEEQRATILEFAQRFYFGC